MQVSTLLNKANQTPKYDTLRVADDDIVVVRYRKLPSRAGMEGAARIARRLFPRNKVLILDDDTHIETLSPEALRAMGLKRIGH
ncbi:MAG TPA: hypothetical protein VFM97_00285 [Gammaproteobacteria bacterium]|nr:hypothetical protein [Gammaproteobacteria bacterium]